MALEIAALATQAVTIVAPALRYLLSRAGKRAADQASDELGDQAWGAAKRVWATIGPKVEASAEAKDAARDLAIDPQDGELQGIFERALISFLQDDRRLAQQLQQEVRIVQNAQQISNVSADRGSFAAGGDIRISGGLRIGSSDSQAEMWSRASAPAKLLMAAGMVAAFAGVGGFILTIAMSIGSSDPPDTSLLGPLFGLGVIGIVVAGLGSMLAALTLRNK